MTIAIVGGIASLEKEYKKATEDPQVKIKIYNEADKKFERQVGSSDVIMVLTKEVSHRAVKKIKSTGKDIRSKIVYVSSSGKGCVVSAIRDLL